MTRHPLVRTAAFWDSSALIPLCVLEPTTNHARQLSLNYGSVVWWATAVEVHSAIARGYRNGLLNDRNRATAVDRLNSLRSTWHEISPASPVREQAEILLAAHPLRAADALQLAAAMNWCQKRPTQRTFISADIRLCDAATSLGFTVIQP